MFLLFETIRFSKGKPYNLVFHQQRMNTSYKFHFNSKNPFVLEPIFSKVFMHYKYEIKCKLSYNEHTFHLSFEIYQKRTIEKFILIERPEIIYQHKYVDRKLVEHDFYPHEVIFTQNGKLADTSFSNLVFYKNNGIFTPEDTLLQGTMRESLIASHQINVTSITTENYKEFSHFSLINAMLPLQSGELYSTESIIFE